MKLSIKGLTIAVALLWGLTFFLVSISNLIWPSYGTEFLELLSTIYPGYKDVGTFGSVIVGTLYALLDGAIGGALLAWLYNRCSS